MAEGDDVAKLISQIHALAIETKASMVSVADTQKRFSRFIDGNGRKSADTRLSTVEDGLERIEKAIEALVQARAVPVVLDDKTKWEAIGKWAQVFGTMVAFVMSLAVAMGWLG